MGKLLEVVRRLAIVITWLIGGGSGIALVIDGYDRSSDESMFQGVVVLMVTYVVHRVINWVLLKEDKPFQD